MIIKIDGVECIVNEVKQSRHNWSEVFVSGLTSRHLLPTDSLKRKCTFRTGGHKYSIIEPMK